MMAVKESVGEPASAPGLARLCVFVWATALILGANTIFALEWSHPYCNNPTDGPAWAAYGFPFPYRRFSGITSLSSTIMPHVLLLNLLLLAALAWPLARRAERRLARMSRFAVALIAIPGFLVLLLGLAFVGTDIAFGFFVTDTLSYSDSYWTYRPVIRFGGHMTDCTPSEFWFGPIAPIARS